MKDIKTKPNKITNPDGAEASEPLPGLSFNPGAGNPSLGVDWAFYAHYLEDSDLSDEEKREFIETLWSIVTSFVDLGFGLHPAQLVDGGACEQNDENIPAAIRKMLSLKDTPKTHFNGLPSTNGDREKGFKNG